MLSLKDAVCSETGTGTRFDLFTDIFLDFDHIKASLIWKSPFSQSLQATNIPHLVSKVDQEKERERERLDERRGRREVNIRKRPEEYSGAYL